MEALPEDSISKEKLHKKRQRDILKYIHPNTTKRPDNMHVCTFEELLMPNYHFGPYYCKWPSDLCFNQPSGKTCELCKEKEARWSFSDAGMARVFGIESKLMFFSLCDDCRDIILCAPKEVRKCAKCGVHEGMAHDHQLFTITLAGGEQRSKPYCVKCLSKGSAREELRASLHSVKRHRRCRSV